MIVEIYFLMQLRKNGQVDAHQRGYFIHKGAGGINNGAAIDAVGGCVSTVDVALIAACTAAAASIRP